MTFSAAVTIPSPGPIPRAEGVARVSSKTGPNGSAIDQLYQKGALKVVFPRSADLTAVLVNTAGGVTGGDRFQLNAAAGADSSLTLTTQAAERAYKALPDETGRIRTHLTAAENARLCWLPQETILFDGANLDRRLRCDLAHGSELLFVEPLILGRAAMGENQVRGQMSDRVELVRDGKLTYLDSWTLAGDLTEVFDRAAVGQGAKAMASLIYVGPRAEAFLDPVRDHFGDSGGASLRSPDVLIGRVLAKDSYDLRKSLVPLLDFLTDTRLPTCWRL